MKRVILALTNEIFSRGACVILNGTGRYNAIECATVADALMHHEAERGAAIVTDIAFGGFELFENLREKDDDVPIVLIASGFDEGVANFRLSELPNVMLRPPTKILELTDALEKAIRVRMQKEIRP